MKYPNLVTVLIIIMLIIMYVCGVGGYFLILSSQYVSNAIVSSISMC